MTTMQPVWRHVRAWLLWLGRCVHRALTWLLSTDQRIWIATAFVLIGFGLYKGWALQRDRDQDRVTSVNQRCTLIEHIIAVPDAAGAPERLTLALRRDLAACRATQAKYRSDAE